MECESVGFGCTGPIWRRRVLNWECGMEEKSGSEASLLTAASCQHWYGKLLRYPCATAHTIIAYPGVAKEDKGGEKEVVQLSLVSEYVDLGCTCGPCVLLLGSRVGGLFVIDCG